VLFQVANGFRRPAVESGSKPSSSTAEGLASGSVRQGSFRGSSASSSAPAAADGSGKRDSKECGFCGKMLPPRPTTARDKWHWVHFGTAWSAVAMALYQIQSGLKLYTAEYNGGHNTHTAVAVFWVWVSVLVILLLGIKFSVVRKTRKTRSSSSRSTLRPQTNLMPDHPRELEGDDSDGGGFVGSRRSPSISSYRDNPEDFDGAVAGDNIEDVDVDDDISKHHSPAALPNII